MAFIFGAFVSAIMTLCLMIWLSESVDFLLMRRPDKALERINKLLCRMRLETIESLPEKAAKTGTVGGIRMLLSKAYLPQSALMWISIFTVFTGFYFITSWTPKLLVDAGWTLQQAIFANVVINIGGSLSGFGFGYLSVRAGYRWAVRSVLFLTLLSFVLFGMFGDVLSLRFVLPLFLGFFLFGTLVSQYILLPRLYETAIRSTGTGWALGIGRLGAVAAPFVAGQMLAAGWEGFDLYFIYAGAYVISLTAVSTIWALAAREPQ